MTTRMRPITKTIPIDEAKRIIDATIRPTDRIERIPLIEANGRALASEIVSTVDVPPFARAAMDGFAVRAEDTAGSSRSAPRVLHRIERVFTGQVAERRIGAGECIEIATGAPLPDGADAVVMVEETESNEDVVRVLAPVSPRQNVGRKGSDIEAGQRVLPRGDALTPSRVGSIAALGIPTIEVYARPRVAILSTGNEIVEPGQPLAPGHIHDINKYTLASIVSMHGGVAMPSRTVSDTIDDLARAVDESLNEDILVFSGGSSVGERDLILDIIAAKGEVLFHGISVKPGKPTAFGVIGGKPVFGMPGYPTSCLTNAYILLAPALRRIARLPAIEPRTLTLPLGQRIVSAAGRHQFYTVRIADGVAMPAFKASGDITSMSRADGYIEIPEHTDIVDKDTVVTITLF